MNQLLSEVHRNIQKARSVSEIPPTEYQVPYSNIGDLLKKQAEIFGDKPWLIFYPDDIEVRRIYTYKQFYDLVCRTANFLLSQGITRDDRIATIAFNHADTVVHYFAAWVIGAVVVPINVGEDDKRIGYILENSQSKLAFVREEFVDRVEKILAEIPTVKTIVRVGNPHPRPLSQWERGGSDVSRRRGEGQHLEFHEAIHNQQSEIRNLPDVSLEDEALIVYTSGTTGLPKGVVITQYNLLIDAKAIAEWHGMTPDQRMMCVLPIHHVNGTVVTLLTPMYYGGSVVLNQKFHSDKFFELITKENIHVVSVVPTLLQFLLHENLDMSKYDIRQFRHIICGAGPLTCELALTFEDRFHIPIVHGYGLSETTCYSCFLPLDLSPDEHRHWLSDFGFPAIGAPIPSNEMAIHDDKGNELPEGMRGEIVIRGHNVMKEYFNNTEVNEKTFAYGWFRSGDEGFYKTDANERKFFFITGRIKELIIRGGVNISPFEIDEVLMNMPGVKAGLAVGFENDWYGEEIGAYVQLKDSMTLTEDQVIQYCHKYLSFQKCPKVVIFGNNIPVTSTGKYQRNKLKPLFEKWKNVQFAESQSKSKVKSKK
ncbi:MAG: acyl--CoA ligase [Ignavibacteriae bacterium]|nr:acyl--CoA ligase [Ignavibacteria bacterium]MBI3363581.1 acyl--CoA ligase [Ignavibacteriota bacterium]